MYRKLYWPGCIELPSIAECHEICSSMPFGLFPQSDRESCCCGDFWVKNREGLMPERLGPVYDARNDED